MDAVDLFAGAGGTTTGAKAAGVTVLLAINHWPRAVETHAAAHPDTAHHCEDAAVLDPTTLPTHDLLLAPLKELRPLWRHLRTPPVRLRKRAGETRGDGTLVDNQHRMGPIVLAAREAALEAILDIQARINAEAARTGREPVDLLNAKEAAFIRECIRLGVWPQRWTGDEPRGDEPFEEHGQALLFNEDEL